MEANYTRCKSEEDIDNANGIRKINDIAANAVSNESRSCSSESVNSVSHILSNLDLSKVSVLK